MGERVISRVISCLMCRLDSLDNQTSSHYFDLHKCLSVLMLISILFFCLNVFLLNVISVSSTYLHFWQQSLWGKKNHFNTYIILSAQTFHSSFQGTLTTVGKQCLTLIRSRNIKKQKTRSYALIDFLCFSGSSLLCECKGSGIRPTGVMLQPCSDIV